METCVSNDFDKKIEEVTRNFAEQMLEVKNELEAAKETNQLNMLHFNGEIKKIKTELQSTKESLRLKTAEHNAEIKNLTSNFHGELKKVKTELEKVQTELKGSKEILQVKTGQFDAEIEIVKKELESSKTTLDQLRRENALLRENQENATKNQDNIVSKIDKIAQSSSQEIEKIKTELKSTKETLQLQIVHLNGDMKKVKTELRSSKTRLDQLQHENARLKENLVNVSKNQENLMTRIENLARSSSKEPIFFDYSLGNHMTSTGKFEIVKFDRPRAVSATKIYNESTGKVTIEEDGLYFFYAHGSPYEKSGEFNLYIYVDYEMACRAYKEDGTRAHMSCAIVRHLKRGQTIYVQKWNKLQGDRWNPHTGFLGFKLQ